jgi:hypothetical protein
MRSTKEWGSDSSLILDADVIDNPARFAEKYAPLRPEPLEQAKALLQREAELIGDFIQSGGVLKLAKEIFAESPHLPADHVAKAAEHFTRRQFVVEGVTCDHPLESAVWRVDAPDGKLLAQQHYTPATETKSRGWHLGTEPEVKALAQERNVDALGLAKSAELLDRLPKRNLSPQVQTPSHGIAM